MKVLAREARRFWGLGAPKALHKGRGGGRRRRLSALMKPLHKDFEPLHKGRGGGGGAPAAPLSPYEVTS